MNETVFGGKFSVRDFLDPKKNEARLIRLPPKLIGSFHDEGVEIWVKVYGTTHVKFTTAVGLLTYLSDAGSLKDIETLAVPSSGNLVCAVRILSPYFGIKKVLAVVPPDTAGGMKHFIEEVLGMEMLRPENEIVRAIKSGDRPDIFWLDQYNCLGNPLIHETVTGPQILEQVGRAGGDIALLGCALGSTGTMYGSSVCLRRERGPDNVTILALVCYPKANDAVPGVRNEIRLKEIGFNWRLQCDAILPVSQTEAYLTSVALIRAGIPAGPSSGLALAGTLNYLCSQREGGFLDKFRGSKKKVVVILPADAGPLIDKYSTPLDPEHLGDEDPLFHI